MGQLLEAFQTGKGVVVSNCGWCARVCVCVCGDNFATLRDQAKKDQPLHGFTTAKRQDRARVQYSGDFESHLILALLTNEIRGLFLIPRCAVE